MRIQEQKNKKKLSTWYNKQNFSMHAEWLLFIKDMKKNASNCIWGTLKCEIANTSLYNCRNNEIITVEAMLSFCEENLQGVEFKLKLKEEISEQL